jgi:tRNA A-37 threonylcarbamoyl transferase component Bud32
MHTDCNEEQNILVYPYFKGTLLSLIQEDPELPFAERTRVLRLVGEAIQELHRKDWIHIGADLLSRLQPGTLSKMPVLLTSRQM